MGSLSDVLDDPIMRDAEDIALPDTSARPRLAVPARAPSAPSLRMEATLANPIACVGRGLHTGAPIRLRINPAQPGHGIVFQRTDLANAAPLPARFDHVIDTRLSTVIGDPQNAANRCATIEHLMAALSACAIDNALIEIDGPEVPVLDGSSAEFVFLLSCAGRSVQATPSRVIEILRRVHVTGPDGAWAELRPARDGLTLAMDIDFACAAIGQQHFAMRLDSETFAREVANCRTFVQRADIEALQRAGLARGGSLDNAIVVDGAQVLNPTGLRRADEFVRHKLLDAVGDLALAGTALQARFSGYKSGHGLNNQLLHALFADRRNWRPVNPPQNAATKPARIRVAA